MAGEDGMLAGTIERAGEVTGKRMGGHPAALCSASGTGGSQCTVLF
ncbi:hypothetical protein BN159_7707 [Streptomyces davaonensis JCM 4913]|uniref:Uncharacterized protein n=1 Tax=Streptomyces davaonensis (strain DSM 101723 / JCM 4913 / KCC S-0913 / 768) TaxID=1214101 RepID=K4R731_STRDJ|nr:hypothetical protein [Streptomyces davaonensis]CCK32086.1 hypothetical protein BN159_7707 [Streptomyces davaonensis JCM 4913]